LAPFIQICASEDDLFALDGQGEVYQYNFHAKTWLKLESRQPDDTAKPDDTPKTRRRDGESPRRS